eukprot:gb/GECG01003858.1/.p1 GENE.gb/GECG01003858.1/~~gb/GECG01003858.1/.p1  ORF type:complete len:1501 (+),score=200.78 gb/GECG01003858.1/:1-4503(+)
MSTETSALAPLVASSESSHLLEQHVEAYIAEKRVLAVLGGEGENHHGEEGHAHTEFEALKSKLFELKSFLEESQHGPEPGTTLEDATHPFPGLPLYHKCVQPVEMKWEKPSSIDVVGSFLLHTMTKPVLNVDLAVEIPDECFEERDIKNYAYFDKKQLYLRAIVSQLLNHPDIKSGDCYMDIAAIHHDKVKSCIRLQYHNTPSRNSSGQDSHDTASANNENTEVGESMKDFAIRIHARVSDRVFKRSQLAPQWNNVQRRSHREKPQPSTPCYNSIVAGDMFMKESLYAFHSALLEVPNAVDAIIFLKRWVNSKGMSRQPDSVNGFLITAIVVLLIRREVVVSEMTVLQILRAVLQFLAENNLCEKHWSLRRVLGGNHQPPNVSTSGDDQTDSDDESTENEESDTDSSTDNVDSVSGSPAGQNGLGAASGRRVANERELNGHGTEEPVPLLEFSKEFDCVLVDPSGFSNLAARMTKDGAGELQRNAVLALTAVGMSGAANKHLKALFSQHEEEKNSGKVDSHSGPAAASVHTVKHCGLSRSFEQVFFAETDPIRSFDRVITSPFPRCPMDDRAAPHESVYKLAKTNQSFKDDIRGSIISKDWYSELASSTVQQREKHLADAYTTSQANAVGNERWEYAAKRLMFDILTRGLSNRVSQLRLYFAFENPYAKALRELIDSSKKDCLNIRSARSIFRLSSKYCDYPWCSPLELRWPLYASPPQVQAAWIAVNLHPVHAKRLVDRGPDAEEKRATQEFSSFWGSKAELRRFADGSIVQAVVWNASTLQRQHIVALIISHLLSTHFSVSNQAVNVSSSIPSLSLEVPLYFTSDYASRLGLNAGKSAQQWFQSAESASSKAMSIVDSLTRALRMVEGVPLRLVDVFPVGSSLRQTALCPPCPHPAAFGSSVYENADAALTTSNMASMCPNVHELMLRFENTSKWPEDLEALRTAKHGFYLQIKKDLEQMLGLEQIHCTVTREFIEVFYEGLVFRLRMFVPHELRLLIQGSLKPASSVIGSTYLLGGYGVAFADPMEQVPGYVNVGSTATAPKSKKRRVLENGRAEVAGRSVSQCQREACFLYKHFILKPRHFSAVSAFASYYPAYGEAVRLASAWLESHMLLHEHFAVEAVELLMASVFCDSRPNLPPQSAAMGFLRFLRLLWSFDWHANPLLVDIESLSSPTDRSSLWQRFAQVRGKNKDQSHSLGDGGPSIFLVTPYERGLWRPQWTADAPNRAVLYRTQRLARDAEEVLTSFLWCMHMDNSLRIQRKCPVSNIRKDGFLKQIRSRFTCQAIPFLSDFSACTSPGDPVTTELLGNFRECWKVAFAPYIDDYDIVVRLNNSSMPRNDGFQVGPELDDQALGPCLGSWYCIRDRGLEVASQSRHEGTQQESELQVMLYKNMLGASRVKMMPGFDPVSLLVDELVRSYGRSILVFRSVRNGMVQGNCSLYISLKQNQLGEDIQETLTNVGHGEGSADRRKEVVSHLMSIVAGIWEKGVGLVKNVQLIE